MPITVGRPMLGIYRDRDGDWPLDSPGRKRDARPPQDEGWPKVIGRSNGWPLEVRVWHSRPRGVEDAVYHPSGCWIAVRVLGTPAGRG